ncbi:hypothetical protein [Pseudomonas sp. Irchel 3E20]|uniref:hypothetical protein n=1 Tax=Pseudomonas sp. Irchel 3E20 TaxID=2008983 RepID=UPI001594F4A6|nr:hypothetical protein [Pseudomonas sp. Irchel 3E20]
MNKQLLMAGLLVTSLAGCGDVFAPASKEVCITGYNQYEWPIHEFRLDAANKTGCSGNPSARKGNYMYGGGGGLSCGCRVTPGKQVTLTWSMARSLDELEAGIPRKEFSTEVIIPQPESSTSRYFRIFFMKDGVPKLQWVDDLRAPRIMPSSVEDLK